MAPGAWWRHAGALDRFMADLLAGEAQALGMSLPAHAWHHSACLTEAGLGVDSLDRIALAAALSEALHLHRGGGDNLLTHDTVGAWRQVASRALDRYGDAITFRTSGSTGRPRACSHRLGDLLEEVDVLAGQFSDRKRVLTFVPSHHIYGFLFTVLLPAHLHLPVVDLRGHSPGALATLARAGDLVVGHPLAWDAAIRSAPRHWPSGMVGVTSGAPCSSGTAETVLAAGLSRLVDVYGASETAGIGWRDDPAAAYALLPYWTRSGDKLRRGPAEAVEAPDVLRWVGDGRFEVVGRRDSMVQVGGHNVSIGHVQDMLLRHPGVSRAVVRLMGAREGNRLKAFVVPANPDDAETLEVELIELVRAKLTPAERPRHFSFGPDLPVAPSGKAADWPMSLTASAEHDATSPM